MSAKKTTWLVLAPVLLITAAVAGLAWVNVREPEARDDSPAHRFARAVNNGDKDALRLLGPEAAFGDEAVSEVEAEALYADFYLRRPGLIILEVRKGEPDSKGKMQATPNRYTLVTKTAGTTPPLRVRNSKGEADRPSQLSMTNPNLVVEVRDGKIHGVRTEVRRD